MGTDYTMGVWSRLSGSDLDLFLFGEDYVCNRVDLELVGWWWWCSRFVEQARDAMATGTLFRLSH